MAAVIRAMIGRASGLRVHKRADEIEGSDSARIAFRRLASDIQSALVEVGVRAEQRGWAQARQNGVETKRVFVEHGLKVIEPSAEMMTEFRAIGRIMMDEWVKRAGPDGEAIAQALSR